jgi:hypothetical protein
MTKLTINRQIALAGSLLACAALAAPFGSQAAGSKQPVSLPPYVYTGTFIGASTTSAVFKGNVNPHGLETVYTFQYGLTTAYGAQTPPANVGNGTVGAKVSQTITELQPGTTYHCRLVATNAAGTTNGQDVTFVTKAKKIPLKFEITATPDPVVFGDSFSVNGLLTGTEAADHEIILQANSFPYLGIFKEMSAPAMTNADGDFSFPMTNLLENAQFRVATTVGPLGTDVGPQAIGGRTIVEQVAARVSLHLRSTGRHGFVHLYGAVEPTEVGASVSFQLLRPHRAPLVVAWTKVGRATTNASRFSRTVRIRYRGLYRAVVYVNNGAQVSGYSRTLLAR